MILCSSFAVNLPACNDNKIIAAVRQQNKLSMMANLMGSTQEWNQSAIKDTSKLLKIFDIKLKKLTKLQPKNDLGLLFTRLKLDYGLMIS